MILNFRAKNIFSIKEEVELSFEASSIKGLMDNVIAYETVNKNKKKILKSVGIFGHNASGKSNLIKSFGIMKDLVVSSNSRNKNEKLPYFPFKLDENNLYKDTSFYVELILNGILYEYGFSYNAQKITKEYLYYYPNGRISTIFERKLVNEKTEYKFTVDKVKQEFLSNVTSDNKLYLAVATNLEYKKTEIVFKWISEKLIINNSDRASANWRNYTAHLISDEKEKEKILKFLKGADFNIIDLDLKKKKPNKINFPDELEIPKSIIEEFENSEILEIGTIKKGMSLEGKEISIPFKMFEESDGTKKFFELAGPFLDILSKGYCLIFDEIDNSLHPKLLVFLINLFNNNITNAQLAFTVHNTIVFNQDYLRRDQIYLMNLDNTGASELYSIHDFKTEKNTSDILKRYLTGRYDGVPFIDNDLVSLILRGNLNE